MRKRRDFSRRFLMARSAGGVIAVILALFVYANRAPLEVCARTCECQLAGQDVSVPLCDPDAS